MEKHPPVVKNLHILPKDKEIMEAVIRATCQYFEITEDELINTSKKKNPVEVKRLCIYLIMKNSDLKDYAVAERFGITRTPVNDGVEIIDTHKKIYRQTSDNLREIAAIANTFEKKYSWHIQ
jgi:chromosomal replication initiation ATPase DnaA